MGAGEGLRGDLERVARMLRKRKANEREREESGRCFLGVRERMEKTRKKGVGIGRTHLTAAAPASDPALIAVGPP